MIGNKPIIMNHHLIVKGPHPPPHDCNQHQNHKQCTEHIHMPSGDLTQLWKMAIEIVSFSRQNGDFPVRFVATFTRG